MDAILFKSIVRLSALALIISSAACSQKGSSSAIDQQDKNALLSASSILQKKGYCLPNPILDEEDIPPLVGDGYKLSPADQYCIPEANGSFDPGDYNCVPYKFVDANDLVYLNNHSYHDTGVEYCNNEIPDTTGGSTTGSTDGGSVTGGNTTDGGSVTGGSTTSDSTGGGSVTGGSTTSDSTGGGSVTGGSTTSDSTGGGSVTGGSTSSDSTGGGSVTGGSTTSDSTGGGSVTGGTTTSDSTGGGSVTGGSTTSDSTGGGSTTGGSTTSDSTGGGSTTGGSTTGGSSTGGGTDGGNSGDGEINWSAPLDRMCSKMRTANGRYWLMNRAQLILQVVERIEDSKTHKVKQRTVCESKDTAQIIKDVVENKKVKIRNCDLSAYKKSDLYLSLYSPVVASDLPISMTDFSNVRFFKKDGSTVTGKDELSFVLYGSRSNRYAKLTEKLIIIVDNNPDGEKNDPKWCDAKASPLVVHVNPDRDVAEYVRMTSIEKGVKFDILGLNSEPVPYAPKQISWLASKQYMFLVKPDKNGKVTGVNQMFGDNTLGPDNDFAANGFLALAKYDSNKDGLIDIDDAVFTQLRLWNDKNSDGKGTPDEMIKLSKAKVKVIDLNYDAGFREQDRYGNETLYKSVIKYDNGSLDLIFDLWFNYKNLN